MNNLKEKIVINEYDVKFSFKKNFSNLNFSFNRSAFIFFIFVLISFFFSIKIFYYGSIPKSEKNNFLINKKDFRADILDRNGFFLSKTVLTKNVGINPNKVKDKKKFLLKLKLIFPEKNFNLIEKKLNKKKFFYLEKKISSEKFDQI